MDNLPHDLLYEILFRLPATTLGNAARHVCQLWRSIISDPTFVDHHHTCLVSNEDARTLLFHQDISNYNEGLVMYTTNGGLEPIRPKHQFPVDMSEGNTTTLVCNGLVLYIYNKYISLDFYLCNPILNQSITLPPMPTIISRTRHRTSGFGYDPITKDYKVVLAFVDLRAEGEVCKSHFYCYTINPGKEKKMTDCYNCWREVGSFDDEVYEYAGRFAGGKLHWFICPPLFEQDILSFDLNTESLKLETFNTRDESTLLGHKFFGVLNGGKLCVHVVSTPYDDGDWSTVWVKEEEDINGSDNSNWIEVSDLKDIMFFEGNHKHHWKKDLFLYQYYLDSRSYVVKDKRNKVVDVVGLDSGLFLSIFVPTLLSLSSIRSLTQHDQDGDKDDMELD